MITRALTLALVASVGLAPASPALAKGPGKATAVWERKPPTRAELKAQAPRVSKPGKAQASPGQARGTAFLGPVTVRRTLPLHANGDMLPELQEALRQPNPPYRALLCAPLPRAQQADCLNAR